MLRLDPLENTFCKPATLTELSQYHMEVTDAGIVKEYSVYVFTHDQDTKHV